VGRGRGARSAAPSDPVDRQPVLVAINDAGEEDPPIAVRDLRATVLPPQTWIVIVLLLMRDDDD
jgi:hypothetical protein